MRPFQEANKENINFINLQKNKTNIKPKKQKKFYERQNQTFWETMLKQTYQKTEIFKSNQVTND